MQLSELTAVLKPIKILGPLDLDITGLAQDSRLVEPGNLFICLKGSRADGHQFLAAAVAQGAVAALVSDWPDTNHGLTIIQVPDSTAVLPELADRYYGYPQTKLTLIGVVGTNGKTTSTFLIKSLLEAAGHKVGLVGTISHLIGDQTLPAGNTTPGVLELRSLMAQAVSAGTDYLVMEVSSHSIAQNRIVGLEFQCGLFTNITQDHLDFHGSFEEYLRVKSGFFKELAPDSWAVINQDDRQAATFIGQTQAQVLSYGIKKAAQVRAVEIKPSQTGVSFQAVTPHGTAELRLKLTGNFNVYNALGALGVGLALGLDLATIKQGLEAVDQVPGRFQLVPSLAGFGVVVDYAHTPDGLEQILRTARELTQKRLWLVFGCGGDRDRGKRPLMGALAGQLADFTIITSDNPRSEAPQQIAAAIESGLIQANPKAQYRIELDRAAAIKSVINLAQPGDLVLIAGKGHETYQIFSDQTIPFDDRVVARAALEERVNGGISAQ